LQSFPRDEEKRRGTTDKANIYVLILLLLINWWRTAHDRTSRYTGWPKKV